MKQKSFIFKFASATHPGTRENNEDVAYGDNNGLFFVIDGVGGRSSGEIAAETAKEVICNYVYKNREFVNNKQEKMLCNAILEANRAILLKASKNPFLKGMGCVATVALLSGDLIKFAHVGDTRIYLIPKEGHIQKITKDQSFVGEQEDAGVITEHEAMFHPLRCEVNVILGQEIKPELIQVGFTKLNHKDYFVICSDGLGDSLPSTMIEKIVRKNIGMPELIANSLVECAVEAGKKLGDSDNVTVVVVEVSKVSILLNMFSRLIHSVT